MSHTFTRIFNVQCHYALLRLNKSTAQKIDCTCSDLLLLELFEFLTIRPYLGQAILGKQRIRARLFDSTFSDELIIICTLISRRETVRQIGLSQNATFCPELGQLFTR